MVGIIKYGAGNIYSVYCGIKYTGIDKEIILIEKPDKKLERINFLVLPGVGSFDSGMEYLKRSGLSEKIRKYIENGRPFLGICLGMQLLFERSEEGKGRGFRILEGEVERFKSNNLKIPHMGWNKLKILKNNLIFRNIPDGSYFYFAHSYFVKTEEDIIYGKTMYGIEFPSVIIKDNIVGVQFHPEKSGILGLTFLKNFLEGKWLQ